MRRMVVGVERRWKLGKRREGERRDNGEKGVVKGGGVVEGGRGLH